MSQPVARQRPSVDLDDFERRLHQHPAYDEDPLAELARLVGEQPDPYGDVFAREAVAHSAQAHERSADYQDAHARREPTFGKAPPRLPGGFAAIEAGLRGALDGRAAPAHGDARYAEPDVHGYEQHFNHQQDFAREQAYASYDEQAGHAGPGEQVAGYGQGAYEQSARQQGAYEQSARQQGAHQQGAYQQGAHQQGAYAQDGYEQAPTERRSVGRSRRPVYLMAGTILVCLLGIGGAFALKGHSRSAAEVRTIMAAAGPTKIQPPADVASEQASGDAAMIGKTNQAMPNRLVSREEQPVDLDQAVQRNAARDAATRTQGDAASVPVPLSPDQAKAAANNPSGFASPNAAADPIGDKVQGFGIAGLPTTKRVKSVSVRPDGSIIANAEPPATDAAPPAPRTGDRVGPVAKASTPKTTSRIGSAPKSTDTAHDDDASAAKAGRKAKPQRVAADNGDQAGNEDAAPSTPKPAKKTKGQRVAAVEPGDQARNAEPQQAESGGGGFSVQLAAPQTEEDARSASSRFAKKYAALSGHHIAFHKALANGKSVYRVRVGSLSREDAVKLCEKLRAEGGSCFIAKN